MSWPQEKRRWAEDEGLQVVVHDAPQVTAQNGLHVATKYERESRHNETFYDHFNDEKRMAIDESTTNYFKEVTPTDTESSSPMYEEGAPIFSKNGKGSSVRSVETTQAEPEKKARGERRICGLRSCIFWLILVGIIALVVAAAGIGAGLGIALRKPNTSVTSSATSETISPAVQGNASTSSAALSTASPTGAPTAEAAGVNDSDVASSSSKSTSTTTAASIAETADVVVASISSTAKSSSTAVSNAAPVTVTVVPSTTPATNSKASSTTSQAVKSTQASSGGIASNLASIGIYTYYGCVTDNFIDNVRALNSIFKYDDQMTIETCQKFCQGYKYFGLEYQEQCYCGTTFSGGAKKGDDSNCDLICKGDKGQLCGGDNYLSVYVGS